MKISDGHPYHFHIGRTPGNKTRMNDFDYSTIMNLKPIIPSYSVPGGSLNMKMVEVQNCSRLLAPILEIDDYAKDGGPGRSDFYVIFTMSLCAL